MKKIYTLTGILLLSASMLLAQNSPNRTSSTIVADVLAQMPVDKQAKYNNMMNDLISTQEEGVLQLVKMMKAPGKGDNSKIEYALNGLTFHVAVDKEVNRLAISNAYVKALDTTKERETLAFIIRQLQIIGKDEAVEKLATFLNNESLAGPAARALSAIGSEKAGKALLTALPAANGEKVKREIVSSLGFMKSSEAENAILKLLNSGDPKLQRTVLKSLSQVGSNTSVKELSTLAKKEDYTLEPTAATDSYINLLGKMLKDGDVKNVEKASKSLMNDASKAKANDTRQAALRFLIASKPSDAIKLALNALKDPYPQYRLTALKAASEFTGNKNSLYSEVMNVYTKAKPEVKTDIAYWITEEANCPDKLSLLKSYSNNLSADLNIENIILKKALANAIVKLRNSEAIVPLTTLLAGKSEEDIKIGQDVLSRFNGDITGTLVKALPSASDNGKIAILELLALRKSSKHLSEIISLTNTGSDKVKEAAYLSLKDVVEAKDITSMYSMLESASGSSVAPLQDAVISALSFMPRDKRFSTIADKVAKTPDAKKHLYYIALASTEDINALKIITDGFNNGNNVAKDAAFEALLSWKDINAADQLLDICKDPNANSYFDRAINSYIRLASSSKLTGENRLVYLREAMSIAKTDTQKNAILRQVQGTNSFQGLIFAGKFLDNKAVQESAAQAVMNIALNNKDFTGKEVEALLNKVMDVLNNPDAGYQKEGIRKHLREVPMSNGYVSIFNGKDLQGWKGLVQNPIARNKMNSAILAREQAKADKVMRDGWYVENGMLIFKGKGDNICTDKQYGDFEMYVDWMLDPAGPEADAGIYLRGTPQVQIWDTARVDVGAQVGSGGLYNNTKNRSTPLKVADNKLGVWNSFFIKMVGDRVTVLLNGELVVDNIILENYWNRSMPIPAIEQIELQAHGCKVYYRDIYVKELERAKAFELSNEEIKEGYEVLFDGTNMHKWTGNTADYTLEDGCISLAPKAGNGHGGNLYTKEEFGDFVYRFEFQLTPGANNGLGIRTPLEGDAAYVGMELQILDHDNPIYNDITKYQVHGSVYGIIGAERKGLKPVGEWNYQEVIAKGDHITITLNGNVILDRNIRDAVKNGTPDKQEHPGLFNKKGHIAFLGHGSPVKFKNIRVKRLK